MTNRTKILERSRVMVTGDCLESLLDSCRRNGRPAKFPPKQEKIYFDADRFRWFFSQPTTSQLAVPALMMGMRNLQQWRDWIDEQMRKEDRETAP